MHRAEGTLRAVEPFDFARSVTFFQGFSPMMGEQEARKGAITKGLMVDGRVIVFRVSGRPLSPEVAYQLFAEETIDDKTEREVAGRISFILSLEDDIKQFYAIAEKDEPYYEKVKALWGLHHVKFPSLLEVSAWAIINQRIQRPIAIRMKRSLVERYGGYLELEGTRYWAFPDYQSLKVAKPSELSSLLKNERKTVRIGSLIDTFPELDEQKLMKLPYDKAVERLKLVNGIGDWSAQFILFRGLGRIEKQRYGVKPVQEMMKEVYGEGRTIEDINRLYGNWCGYWSLYLWASAMSPKDDDDPLVDA